MVYKMLSHPMWVRGLKLDPPLLTILERVVAPHVGAWIETKHWLTKKQLLKVAPHVGAWIETYLEALVDVVEEGRTPCGCVD